MRSARSPRRVGAADPAARPAVVSTAAGTVTRVMFQARAGSERVNVEIDGAYAFSLAAELGFALHEGQQLDEAAIRGLLTRDDAERAYQHALHFLGPRPRSQAEVRRRLREHGYGAEAINLVLQRLQAGGLVDDQAFATYWVTQRQTHHPRGPRALRTELRQKGIDVETVAAVLSTVGDGQDEAAYQAGARKAHGLSTADPEQFTRALSAYLLRRGFDYDAVREATRRLWRECAPAAGRDENQDGS